MKRFDIAVRLEDGAREHAGVLSMGDPAANGRYSAEFRYATIWLKSKRCFALDPESLPLSGGTFSAFNLNPPLAVFQDALPDRWGRSLLLHGLPLSQRSDSMLMALRGRNGLGALEFAEHAGRRTGTDNETPQGDVLALETLLDAAEKFEAGEPLENQNLRRLLAAGTTAGGARPKAVVSDVAGEWIAKFPSKILDGRFDVVGLEKVAMDCARAAGIIVPDTGIIQVGTRKVLLVKRFDVMPQGGRRHMISLSTLCKERPDYRVSRYDDLADAVRRHSASPVDDVARLFRQAVFNGLIGNTDDHLKNFAMLHESNGYRLSPAYDLLPDTNTNQEHALFFGTQRRLESRIAVMDMARRWGVTQVDGILEDILKGVCKFKEMAEATDVPSANIAEIGRDIERRLASAAF